MLIWKGHGILILVFGIIGSVVMAMAVAMFYAVTHWSWVGRLIVPANCWGAAIAIWLYAKTMGKTVMKHYLDPVTRQPVIAKSSHSLFFIPAMPWAIIATLIACMSTVLAFVMPAGNFAEGPPSTSSPAAQAAFKAANQLIDMDKGKGAFGNTPEAEEMAEMFSMLVMLGREMGVEKAKKKSSVSLSHGKFLTYCRINPESCAFMVHVPDLRKFSTEAKKYMVGMAWSVARKQAAELRPQPKRLAVGVRGAFMYDAVVEGTVSDTTPPSPNPKTADAEKGEGEDDEEMNLEVGIDKRHPAFSPEKYLEAYFEPHPANGGPPVIGGGADAMPKGKATTEVKEQAPSPLVQEFNQRVEKFSAQQAGQAEGNSPEAKEIATVYAGAVRKNFPFRRTLSEVGNFSAYVHVRHDTVAFMLGLPGEGQMPPGAFVQTQPVAWKIAEQAARHITPNPSRIAVIFFMDGQIVTSSIGSLNKGAADASWQITEEIDGSGPHDQLLPFFSPSSAKMVALDKPQKLSAAGESMGEAAPSMQAQPPQGAAPADAPASASASLPATLPTGVRDWKDTTGRVMQASLESFTTPAKDAGRFKRADGQVFEVPFARLSAEDQEFIRKMAEQP